MEKGQEQNGGENNPNKTKEDHTHDTSDLDNKGELDGTKTKKETCQEAQKPNEEAQGATDLSNKRENTNASEFGEITGDGSSPGVAGTTPGEQSGMVPSAEYGVEQKSDSLKEEANEDEEPKTEIQVTDHDNWASQREEGPGPIPDLPEEASRTMSSENGSTTQPTTNSPGEALKLKATEKLLKSNNETPAATDTSIITSKKTGNTNASGSEGTGSNSGIPGTTQGELSETVSSAETRVHQKSDSSEDGSSTQPTTDSPSEALKLKATEKVQMSNDQIPAANNNPIITSEKTVGLNTDASRSEGTGSSSVNELMKEPPTTEDNGASQPEGGVEFQIAIDPTSGKTGVSLKIVKPKNPGDNRGGSSAPGQAGGKGVEETEAQKRDANGRSEEEMKTGSGANKDDDKEGQPKKKKAKGEGVEGEGGITHAVKTEQHVIKERSVSISLCTSAYSFYVKGLVSYLKGLMKKHPELIKEVKIHELPYNDLDHYKFDEKDPVDVMILCHSINNRRFAITNVMDALYDEYLPYCARVVGKEKMGVIVHDFDDMRETVQSSRMSSFKYKQPKAFETTSLQITCGHIEKEEQVLKQMLHADREKIVGFLEHASKYPEEMQKEETNWKESLTSLKRFIPDLKMPSFGFGSSGKANEGQIGESNPLRSMGSNIPTAEREQENHGSSNEGTPVDQPASSEEAGGWELVEGNTERDPPRGTSPATQQSPDVVHATEASGTQHAKGAMDLSSQQKMTQNSGKVSTSVPQSLYSTPRPILVSVCSSAYKRNVQGLLSWFTKFQAKQPHMITDVRFRELPYNDIDSFRFPPNDPVDVMILCHSVDNRGFSITNVVNALYEKYLKYCNKLIGKKKLAVIVHDFADCKPAIVEGRMESFRRMQPLTFELVDTVIICGSLEDLAKPGMREEDETRLICFLELARFEPKENFKQSLLGKLF